jgi:hypothetical protein
VPELVQGSSSPIVVDHRDLPVDSAKNLERHNLSSFAKPAKKPIDRTPLDERGEFLSPAFSLRTIVELKLSLRTRLACQMHTRRMHDP